MRAGRDAIPYIKQLNDQFGVDGFIEFYAADGGLPAAYLFHPSGHTLEVYLQGATVTRWLDEQGRNLLFERPDSVYEPGVPITSGVPLSFPQWRDGSLPDNGFASRLTWEVVEAEIDFDFLNFAESVNFTAGGDMELLVDEEGNSLVELPPEGDDIIATDEGAGGDEAAGAAPKRAKARARAEAPAADAAAAAEAGGEPPKRKRGRPRKTDADGGGGTGGFRGAVGAAAVSDGPPETEEGPSSSSGDAGDGGGGGEGEEAGSFIDGLTPDDINFGLIGDIAPYVKLRLRDTEETRAMWPHPFELTVKISLSETDEFPDLKAGLPGGVVPWDGTSDNGFAASGGPTPQGEDDPADPLQQLRLAKTDVPDMDEQESPPMQIKYEFTVTHTGAPEDSPLRFQLAATPAFATRDQTSRNHGRFVRALGLGAKQTFDYSEDPRYAKLRAIDTDYVQFGDRRLETVVINAADADVRFCPGDRTHFELLQRKGFSDALLYHPGPFAKGEEDFWNCYACLGAGRVALPKTLKPGESWDAEYVVRRHRQYWQQPLWDRGGAQPLAPWVPPLAEEEDEDEIMLGGDGAGEEDGGGGGGDGGGL